MSMRYKGGVISATAPTTSTSTAKGIWTTTQQMQAVGASVWPRIPGAPTIGTATAGSASATVAYTVPTDLGAGSVTYTATSDPGGFTGTGASPITVSGLTNGTGYTFSVTGTTPGGTGPASAASNSITPVAPTFIANLYAGYGYSTVRDSSNNIYIFGIPAGSNVTQMAKYNTEGVLQWQKYINISPGGYKYETAIDSSGNLLIAVPAGYQLKVYKVDSNGAMVWQRSIDGWPSGCSGVTTEIVAVCTDSAGNVYVGATLNFNCLYGYTVSKFNSSGTLQFSRNITNNIRANAGETGIAVDSAGSIYFTAGQAVSQYRVALIKLDSGGNLSWQRYFSNPSYSSYGTSIVIDSSNNIYVTGRYDASGQNNMFIAKYNSSGTVQWNQSLDIGYASSGTGIAIDSSANVYVCGETFSTAYAMIMAKYNSSGTIQWQRKITGSFNMFGYDVTVDANDNPVFIGYSYPGGQPRMFFGKFPSDGSKTGTYTLSGQSYTYAVTTSTDSANSPTYATSGVSAASITLNQTTLSNTITDSSLTTGTTTL